MQLPGPGLEWNKPSNMTIYGMGGETCKRTHITWSKEKLRFIFSQSYQETFFEYLSVQKRFFEFHAMMQFFFGKLGTSLKTPFTPAIDIKEMHGFDSAMAVKVTLPGDVQLVIATFCHPFFFLFTVFKAACNKGIVPQVC